MGRPYTSIQPIAVSTITQFGLRVFCYNARGLIFKIREILWIHSSHTIHTS